MIESEEALVRRCQNADRAAFEELVRRTARLVFSRLYLETGDAHRDEDLSQETFLLAWRSIHQVSDPTGFRAWLIAIARSVLVNAGRRDSRKNAGGTGPPRPIFPAWFLIRVPTRPRRRYRPRSAGVCLRFSARCRRNTASP